MRASLKLEPDRNPRKFVQFLQLRDEQTHFGPLTDESSVAIFTERHPITPIDVKKTPSRRIKKEYGCERSQLS